MQEEMDGWESKNVFDDLCESEGRALLKSGRAQVISTRWVITNKTLPGGETKVKARCVLRGYEDVRSVDTNSPTSTILVLRLVVLHAAMTGMEIFLGDVEKAFLNSDFSPPADESEPDIILIRPPMETGRKACGFLKLNKAVYGTIDAPLCWNKTLDTACVNQHWKRLALDPCVYVRNMPKPITFKPHPTPPEVMFNHVDDLAVVSNNGDKALLELGFKMGKVRKAHNEVFVGHESWLEPRRDG